VCTTAPTVFALNPALTKAIKGLVEKGPSRSIPKSSLSCETSNERRVGSVISLLSRLDLTELVELTQRSLLTDRVLLCTFILIVISLLLILAMSTLAAKNDGTLLFITDLPYGVRGTYKPNILDGEDSCLARMRGACEEE